ncbi:hypothetical protein ATB97_19240 [Elizabethkingia bruuniana]|nr:hypothetical protein [Elizabethkingia bruuniana]KGO10437.1 hypothetical protein KS04_09205 [Elizabethkingia miricola]MDV3604998.1 hypothetical protein [Elizabethkingia anophelis]AQX86104.1 hypothetical protein AYC65_14315 [Elizabethkingia bruuniana]AQX86538.1 hypothetical protein AYC65_16680 [Elizabethkingia bruuniana]KUY27272.1 hypothetical protein ATB97_19240 [Elizabethkingia bruuniana]
MFLQASKLYQYNEMYFTENSRLIADTKNFNFYLEIDRIEKISPLIRTDILAVNRGKFFHVPLYWSDKTELQAALKANLSCNYNLSPLELYLEFEALDFSQESPLPESALKILKAYL